MERVRSLDTPDYDKQEEKLLPEIATLLDMSISQLEQYPTEIKQALCLIYVNNSNIEKEKVISALNNIVQLDTDIKEIPPSRTNKIDVKETKTKDFQISIRNLKRNARLISQRILENNKTVDREQEEIQYKGGNNNA